MIFVQGESSIEAQERITNVFMSLLPNEDIGREYLKEASRDLNTLSIQNVNNINPKTFSIPLYDFDSIKSIEKCIKTLSAQLQPLPRKTKKELFIFWSRELAPIAIFVLMAMLIVN
jgi:hypothetical protein